MKPMFTKVCKIEIAVKDIDSVIKTYSDIYGIGPWNIFEFNSDNVKDMIINDKKVNYKTKVARANIGDIEIVLVQPLDNLSICSNYLKEHGEGLYSIAYQVENFDAAMDFFKKRNIGVYQSGNWLGKYAFVYLKSQEELGHIIEINKIEPGFLKKVKNKYGNTIITNPTPGKVYPSEDEQDKIVRPFLQKILEIAFVVKSIDKSVRTYSDIYGIGPWEIWEFSPDNVFNMRINGKRADYKMRVAEHSIGDTFIELIEPLDDICIYSKYLKQYGEGIHHIAYKVEDFNKALKYFKSRGIEEYQSGNWGGQYIYLYVKSTEELRQLVELWDITPGAKWPSPFEIYPKNRQDQQRTWQDIS